MVVYVQEHGAVIHRHGEGLEIRKQGALLYRLPLIGLERLIILGYVQVTTQALHSLSAQGVDVLFASANGRAKCLLSSIQSNNIFLRLAQYQRATDAACRLDFAKRMVQAKLASQIRWIREQKWPDSFDWKEAVEAIQALQASLPSRDTLEAVRGVEGSASRRYFGCFAVKMEKLKFASRSRRPAKDQANALLNLGYAFLMNECLFALDACGLDSSLGFMHGVVYGRKSLALDFMEPFRAEAVDRLVLRLSGWGMITEADFVPDQQTGFRLTQSGFRTFAEQFEKQMTDEVTPIRSRLRSEAEKLRYALLEGVPFCPWKGD